MIYFDNSATSGYKPPCVIKTYQDAILNLNANPGRSGHKLSVRASEKVYEARKKSAGFFDCPSVERVIFTPSCTYALNNAIFGLYQKNSTVITTATEHNSALRPLFALDRRGEIKLKTVYPKTNKVTAEDIKNKITSDTKMIVLNAVSNVNGAENDVEGIGKLAKSYGITFVVDGAQIGGHKKISLNNEHIDALCLAGHKGLLALQGVGVLLLSENANPKPIIFGGSGVDSFSEDMPSFYPEREEAGTLNLPAICSLSAGIDYLEKNLPYISNNTFSLTEYLISALENMPQIKVYSSPNVYGIVAFSHRDIPSQELTQILSDKFGIAVRGGFHCAPLMHKFLNTQKSGLVRVSLSFKNTRKEIDFLLSALRKI